MEAENAGLTTREALLRLATEVEQVLWQFEKSQKSRWVTRVGFNFLNSKTALVLSNVQNALRRLFHRKCQSYVHDALNHASHHTTISLVSGGVLLVASVCLFLGYLVLSIHGEWLLLHSVVILLYLIASIVLELYDNKLRHQEVPERVRAVLKVIKEKIEVAEWAPENYPDLFSPFSPCITLQWTYRDSKLVNLPWSLLVKGDIILIRPGQISPGYCEALDKTSEFQLLHSKQVNKYQFEVS